MRKVVSTWLCTYQEVQRSFYDILKKQGCKFSRKSSNSSDPHQYEVVEPDENKDIEDQMLEFAMLEDESSGQPASSTA
eukprot:12407324-Karenia_brevis.AAC.1